MTNRSKILLLCPAAIAGVAVLLYAGIGQRQSTAVLADMPNHIKENVQRGAVSDIHRYLVPVTKGSSKQVS